MAHSLHAPHKLIQDFEKIGLLFAKVIPHTHFDRYIFLRGDLAFHISYNGIGFAFTCLRLKKAIKKHLHFNLSFQELVNLIQTTTV
jgi:hypothetical protein